MHCWKVTAVLLLCSLLLSQAPGASLQHQQHQEQQQQREQPWPARRRRMTPFWRGVSLRPVGASCRDSSECVTMLCRKNRCFLRTASE
ncbi:PREDICTED: liver-expressed antimicrobial peptide 2 [Merops nubicus]|uniref:liver-expressed antimicrobial peptide 2 n=1 Tax=Merops nubicus TaxID=57421 RepID=UPI0004F020F1|nr:PREDICTED: liver-expressed antimicrobial peptide 2 [Merops nubicus]